MGWLKKEIMPALMTAGGATAMAFGQPEGIPMLIAGLGSGIGSAVGGPAGQGIASAGQLASLPADPGTGPMGAGAGAAGGGAPSLTETALPGGTTALPEMAPAGRGLSAVAPLLLK